MDLDSLSRRQHGVLSRAQVLARVTPETLRWALRSQRWQVLHPGVYVTHSGTVDWLARASGALLHHGQGSALSLQSAAHLLGIEDRQPALVHVVVPHARRTTTMPGVRSQRRRRITTVTRRALTVTSAAQTVIDLADHPLTDRDDAIAIAARAVQRRKTGIEDLAAELTGRRSHRHRLAVTLALGLVAEGAESGLEVDFVTGVVDAHGLPPMRMAVPDTGPRGRIRRDFVDAERGVVVETDGVLGHDGAFRRTDNRRDRHTAARGGVTLRTDWVEVHFEPCALAADLAGTLRARGWTGVPRACGPSCPVPRTFHTAA